MYFSKVKEKSTSILRDIYLQAFLLPSPPPPPPRSPHHNPLLLLRFSPVLSLALTPGLSARKGSTTDSIQSWRLKSGYYHSSFDDPHYPRLYPAIFPWPSLHNMKRRYSLLLYAVTDTVEVNQRLSS